MKEFFKRLKLELEDVREDITSDEIVITAENAGDFGCGIGFSTLSLMILLNLSKSIGVDKDRNVIQYARTLYKQVKDSFLSGKPENQEQMSSEIEYLTYDALKHGEVEFRIGNITSAKNLPRDLDLAYCRRILTPIYLSEYDNLLSGEFGVRSALERISLSIKPGGWLIVSEKVSNINFQTFLEQADFNILARSKLKRGDIIEPGRRVTLYKNHLIRYICLKR